MAHSNLPVVVLGTNAVTAKQVPHSRSLFIATQEFVRRNPIATRQMVVGMLMAQRYVADPNNRKEVIDLFCRQTRQDPRSSLQNGMTMSSTLPSIRPMSTT
jgi:ABC-type nitrate/sulfonate/bicarbonate transport system substrate-binding protein